MTEFVRVAVNVPSPAGVFDYVVPDRLAGQIQPGNLVLVPFGTKNVHAVVIESIAKSSVVGTKEIASLGDPQPVMTPAQIHLARSMEQSTLSPLAAVIGLFLPPGLAVQADTRFSITNQDFAADELGEVQRRLVKLLEERGGLRGRQIERALPQIEWRKAAQSLVRRGILEAESVLPPARVRPKFVRRAQLAVSPAAAEAAIPKLGNRLTQARRAKALRYLIGRPEAINVSWIYAESGCNLVDLQELAERQLITLQETEIWRDPVQNIERQVSARADILLSAEQQAVWDQLETALGGAAARRQLKPFLLQGVTGSGKTELYIRAACEAIRLGRQAIILVPEIALTPQTVQRFVERFPGQTGLVHSRLSEGERYDTWRRARAGLLKVIIGPRSALFTPLPDIGLIVLDECHDASYYQSEPPFYNAASAAQTYAEFCSAVCILGSATPSVVQRYQAEVGRSTRLELKRRIGPDAQGGAPQELAMPPVQIVDMREELKVGNRGILSRELQSGLSAVLKQGEQAILFMNRRGTATYVFCRICGFVMKCPRCQTPLTYHLSSGQRLFCHRCGHTEPMPAKCPHCGNLSLRAYGLGTEKVESEVQSLFPRARTLRWDWETTRQKDAHNVILGHFAARRADVLIGTQMLAKGLDLPHVTLVGMVLADAGLYLPDPFAAERVFQVLTQVAGRAGRSSRGGRAVLQTFEPDHYAIRAAAMHDVDGFYSEETAQRRRLGYPPFTTLMRIEFRHYDARRAESETRGMAARLRDLARAHGRKSLNIVGPAPSFHSRVDGKYRWQIVVRGGDLRELLPDRLGLDWRIEVEPASLL